MNIFGMFAGLRAGNQSDNTWTGKIFSIYSKDIWMYNVIFTVIHFFFSLSRKALAAATLVRMEEHVWTFSTHITVFVPATGLWVQQTCRKTHTYTHTQSWLSSIMINLTHLVGLRLEQSSEEASSRINHLYCDLFDDNLHGHKQGVKCTLAADSEILMQKKEKLK